MNAIEFPDPPALQAAISALPQILQDALATVGPQALLSLIPDLAHYPSPPAGSTLPPLGHARPALDRRPARVARGRDAGLCRHARQRHPYGPYVRDPTSQAPWMHHWDTTQDVLDAHTADIAALLARALATGLAEGHA